VPIVQHEQWCSVSKLKPPSSSVLAFPRDHVITQGNNADRDLAELGKQNAKHEQEHVASRDYDVQRKRGVEYKPPKPKKSPKPKASP
jgi:hypothetical protein